MSLYRFSIVVDVRHGGGLVETEMVLALGERIDDVVRSRVSEDGIKGVQIEAVSHVVAMTLPQVVPPSAQDAIRRRQVSERRRASPVSEIDKG